MKKGWYEFPWISLLEWYEANGRHDLPWRDYTPEEDLRAYRVWMSEIFLQQTQVERVRGYFSRILDVYPTIHHLARASYDEFFPYYQGMGYYSRARNLLQTANIVAKDYDGKFPREKPLLQKLPGVGGYTSSAILAFAYGETFLAWDTNLEKVFSRYTHGNRHQKLSEGEKREIEEDFRRFIQRSESDTISTNLWGIGGGNSAKMEYREPRGKNRVATPEGFGTFDSKSTPDSLGSKNTVRAINNALMDFASLIDLKNPDAIDWENYPIRKGVFFETKGNLEPKEVKKSLSFPTPDATVIVTLHEEHKIYYGSPQTQDGEYSDFVLPPALHRDNRKYVQDYFRDIYGLELSVRPPHKKWMSEDGKPYIAVNAQIQAGVPSFKEFEKKNGIFAKMSRMR